MIKALRSYISISSLVQLEKTLGIHCLVVAINTIVGYFALPSCAVSVWYPYSLDIAIKHNFGTSSIIFWFGNINSTNIYRAYTILSCLKTVLWMILNQLLTFKIYTTYVLPLLSILVCDCCQIICREYHYTWVIKLWNCLKTVLWINLN